MGLLDRARGEAGEEGRPRTTALVVDFCARRPGAFLLSIEGDWDTAREIVDCLTSAGQNGSASLNVVAGDDNEHLSLTVQIQASETDASIGMMFEEAGQIIRSLEDAGIVKAVQMS